ncbi:hypothetical protein [Caulobacter sp. 17J80-11]|uniref:hypothetical protein n=1 Tax=Caulobacter sp. 17J80-11 TaxID=2763502 RepID=UPI001653CF00|nr:hypothetical protein [Caulobacter sp. 17J80-11]MBC6981859.1 hypothetical protein [Caulobacter sp. 17J80-11]
MGLRFAAAALSLILLAGCAPTETAAPKPVADSSVDVASCQAKGGTVKPVCRRQLPQCVIAYPDAGKSCTDGSQCAGDCLYQGDAAPGTPVTGQCQADSDPCGCKTPVVGGKVGMGRCVD